MLETFNSFIYKMNNIYLKEIDEKLVLNFIEKFYKNLTKVSFNMDPDLIDRLGKAIIVAIDTIILQKSPIKDKWIHQTGENFILKTNRGNETFDDLLKEVIDGRINLKEITIILNILILYGVESEYTQEFLSFIEKKPLELTKVESYLSISNINKLKKLNYNYFYIGCFYFGISLLITEIYYFISLYNIHRSTVEILNSIRSIYGL